MRCKLLVMLLLSGLTLFLVVGVSEWWARALFSTRQPGTLGCMIVNDPVTGTRARQNCVCYQKTRESPFVEYRFNNRGHRAGFDLYPKPPGTYRIVVVGSSMAEGLRVPWSQTFGALLPGQLSAATGKKVEVYDEGLEYGTPLHIDKNFREVLDAQPDLILWVITKWDIENVDQIQPPPPSLHAKLGRLTSLFSKESFGRAVEDDWRVVSASLQNRSAALFLVNHFLSSDRTEFLKRYLNGDGVDFLKTHPSRLWKRQLSDFATYSGDIAQKARLAGVPLITTVLPTRAEAAMISGNAWPTGFDPYRFGEDIRSAVMRKGGTYIDLLTGFRNVRAAENDFYAIDGHPNVSGHSVLTKLLTRNLRGLIWQENSTARLLRDPE